MIAIVTATTDPERARDCIESWEQHAKGPVKLIVVINGRSWTPDDAERTGLQATWVTHPTYLGSVPAFRLGMLAALDDDQKEPPEIIACLHDDFRIDEPNWDLKVERHFSRNSACGLLGFGGAVGLGSDTIYREPYDPMQLARIGFRSNLDDAENHGLRSLLAEPVACLDGFSQIGRRLFWDGYQRRGALGGMIRYKEADRPWNVLADLGFVHHFYDGALGCLATRYNWETWYLPLRGHHFGGRTAVGDAGYATWAQSQTEGGDQGFWTAAHAIGYRAFKNELPIRL